MKIDKVVTARKMGDFVIKLNHRNKIDLNFLPNIQNSILTDSSPRIYLIVVDGSIKKIGGSAQKGGIKGTMSFYTGAMTGSPGVPRFVVHLLIREALDAGSKVELYMITSPRVDAKIPGLFGYKSVQIASFKEMEDFCKKDYFEAEGRYPDWNFQESHTPYPALLAIKHVEYHKNRLRNK